MPEHERGTRDQATLADILRACRLSLLFVEGQDRDAFLDDLKTQAAVLHEVALIGEGVRRLSATLQSENPGIPWRQIAGMRNHLIHQYDTVDFEEVWRTVTVDIPTLIEELERLVQPSANAGNDAV